jgi:predicted MFS family arabinose efflux permease
LIAVLALPRAKASEVPEPDSRLQARDFKPEIKSYTSAFGLLAIPMVAFVVMLSMVRLSGHSIQSSFYVVFLNGEGISGTAIGLLFASAAIAAACGALAAAPLTRMMHSSWLLAVTSFLTVFPLVMTPLLGLYILFLAAQVVRGVSVGISTPLIITGMSHAVGPDQGKAVGLRTMSNRLTSTVIPIAMGALVAWVGLEASFLVAGGVITTLMGGIILFGRARRIL